jgi:ketosteroid isomerase-like protein
MSDEQELLALEAQRCAAISTGDVDALAALLSEDYVHVHMNAHIDDRAGHLSGVAKRPRTTTRGNLTVRVFGELAVLTGEMTNHMEVPGDTPRVMRAYCQQVAARRDGTWRFVSHQVTALKGRE